MRLIDADEFIVNLKDYIDKPMTAGLCGALVELAPTAYDVDKVVVELEENAGRYTKKYVTPYGNNGNNGYRDTKAISVNRAIEIVKQSGVSDDVCEWREEGLFLYTSCGDRVNAYSDDFKYCPYCSKRIKVVE